MYTQLKTKKPCQKIYNEDSSACLLIPTSFGPAHPDRQTDARFMPALKSSAISQR